MIISWFTQPPGKFSSYYQYDTVTQEFSRTRLELGRASASRTNDTFVSYKPQRSVGFSSKQYSTSNPSKHWSVNDDGALCYDGNPLPSDKPSAGDRVYDASDPSTFVHRGNPVTEKPVLPEGIEPKHLALLANDAMQNGQDIRLTAGDASAEELIGAIKGEVCRVAGAKDFASITDEMILGKLTSQMKIISGDAVGGSVSSMDEALTAAKKANILINEQIEEGLLTPNKAFEDAFGSLQSTLTKAQAASSDADVRQALAEIGKAQQAVNTAIENIDAAKYEAVAKQLDLAKESLSQAEEHANDWQAVEEEYKPLAEAGSIDEYEKEIGIPEGEEVVV